MWETDARFCPMCGARLATRLIDGRDRGVCPSCRFVFYKNPAVAAAAVVLRAGEVLLIRRGIMPYRGTWTLPAGYEEYDERPDETAVRETREETGLDVRVSGLYDVHYTEDDPRKRALLIVYLCEVVGGTLRAADDALDARFFALDALPDEIGFANNRRVLGRLVGEVSAGGPRSLPLPPATGF